VARVAPTFATVPRTAGRMLADDARCGS
jgi:hypothetical protein